MGTRIKGPLEGLDGGKVGAEAGVSASDEERAGVENAIRLGRGRVTGAGRVSPPRRRRWKLTVDEVEEEVGVDEEKKQEEIEG